MKKKKCKHNKNKKKYEKFSRLDFFFLLFKYIILCIFLFIFLETNYYYNHRQMAVHRSIGGRDPLAYPKLENDDNFVGKREIRVEISK